MPIRLGPLLAETPLGMGVLGAVVSGSNAAAKNAHLLRKGSTRHLDAARDVGNEALKGVVVTTAGAAVITSFGGGLLTSLGATLVIGTLGKYAWDRGCQSVADRGGKTRAPARMRRQLRTGEST
jgi:hypothetical protein